MSTVHRDIGLVRFIDCAAWLPLVKRPAAADRNSYRMSTCTVVVPCYNESARLDNEAFVAFAQRTGVRLLFVDDGSTDDTLQILTRLAQRCPNQMRVHALTRNSGKAEAVRLGLLDACADGSTYVAFWDADLATPLDEVVAFLQLLDSRPDIDMVFGARVGLLGRSIRRRMARHYAGRVFATAASLVLGIAVYDTQCGAKMFRVSDRFVEQLREPFIGGWIFDVEMIARDVRARRGTGLPRTESVIYEYPLPVWRDVAGSKIKVRDWLVVGANLGRIYFKYFGLRRE